MERLVRRAEAIAREGQRRRVSRVGAELRDAVPGALADEEADRVVISGRGLVRRWLSEPALRFVGSQTR